MLGCHRSTRSRAENALLDNESSNFTSHCKQRFRRPYRRGRNRKQGQEQGPSGLQLCIALLATLYVPIHESTKSYSIILSAPAHTIGYLNAVLAVHKVLTTDAPPFQCIRFVRTPYAMYNHSLFLPVPLSFQLRRSRSREPLELAHVICIVVSPLLSSELSVLRHGQLWCAGSIAGARCRRR